MPAGAAAQVRLDLSGIDTRGAVTDRASGADQRPGRVSGRFESRRPEQCLYSHRVTYSFAPAPGQPAQTATRAVPEAVFRAHPPGTAVTVRHLPGRPEISEALPLSPPRLLLAGLVAGGLALLALSGVLALRFGGRALSLLRATRGERRSARVVAHLATEGADHRRMLRLSWIDATGAMGDSLPVPGGRDLPAPGDAITVLVDPRTGRVWWQGDI